MAAGGGGGIPARVFVLRGVVAEGEVGGEEGRRWCLAGVDAWKLVARGGTEGVRERVMGGTQDVGDQSGRVVGGKRGGGRGEHPRPEGGGVHSTDNVRRRRPGRERCRRAASGGRSEVRGSPETACPSTMVVPVFVSGDTIKLGHSNR